MAIVKEFFEIREDGTNLYRTYSNENKYIRKVGTDEIYSDAVDVENTLCEYIETNELITDIKEEIN